MQQHELPSPFGRVCLVCDRYSQKIAVSAHGRKTGYIKCTYLVQLTTWLASSSLHSQLLLHVFLMAGG